MTQDCTTNRRNKHITRWEINYSITEKENINNISKNHLKMSLTCKVHNGYNALRYILLYQILRTEKHT